MVITINLCPSAAERMKAAMVEVERTAADLATCAVEEALLNHYRHTIPDPGDGL